MDSEWLGDSQSAAPGTGLGPRRWRSHVPVTDKARACRRDEAYPLAALLGVAGLFVARAHELGVDSHIQRLSVRNGSRGCGKNHHARTAGLEQPADLNLARFFVVDGLVCGLRAVRALHPSLVVPHEVGMVKHRDGQDLHHAGQGALEHPDGSWVGSGRMPRA